MVGLAAVIGRQVGIRPKRRDDRLVVPNLWGMVIGRPGLLKTPSLSEALRPLRRLEIAAKKAHDEELKRFEASEIVQEERKKEVKAKVRKVEAD